MKFVAVCFLLCGALPVAAQNKQTALRTDLDTSAAVYRYVEQMPQFAGSWGQYLNAQLTFPEEARERYEADSTLQLHPFKEKVMVQFIVCEDGGICNLKVIKGSSLYPELNNEALRVIRESPLWKPGEQNGKKVKTYFTQPIIFMLD